MFLTIIGWAAAILSIAAIWAAIMRFSWLQQHFPRLCHWGRGGFGWPASRESVLLGNSMGLLMGLMIISHRSDPDLRKNLGYFFVAFFFIAIPLAVRDHRRYRRTVDASVKQIRDSRDG